MVGARQRFDRTALVARMPEEVTREIIGAVSGASGYTVAATGMTIVLSRRYIPTWAVIRGEAGLVFLLAGPLLFLVKETETLTITLRPAAGGTELTATGLATPEVATRLTAVLTASAAPIGLGAGVIEASIARSSADRLAELDRLRDAGAVTEAEYAAQRQKILAQL